MGCINESHVVNDVRALVLYASHADNVAVNSSRF